jgi:hypothetical protein
LEEIFPAEKGGERRKACAALRRGGAAFFFPSELAKANILLGRKRFLPWETDPEGDYFFTMLLAFANKSRRNGIPAKRKRMRSGGKQNP